jgi:hypothetical protein
MIFSKGASANTLTQQSGKCGGQHPMRGGATTAQLVQHERVSSICRCGEGAVHAREAEGVQPNLFHACNDLSLNVNSNVQRGPRTRALPAQLAVVCARMTARELCTNGQTQSALSLGDALAGQLGSSRDGTRGGGQEVRWHKGVNVTRTNCTNRRMKMSQFGCQKQRRADKAHEHALSLSILSLAGTHACMHA